MRRPLYHALLGLVVLLIPGIAAAQTGTVQGRITERGTGLPVPGVNVTLEGTSLGTATDVSGEYAFAAPAGQYNLVISAIGYKRLVQPVVISDGQTVTANIEIEQDVLGLDDVVITGYGAGTERRNLSTSVSSVSGSDIRDLPVTTADAALQGRVAGVTVLRSSGTPGGGVSVRIRGATSISGSNQPLYVVDGVPVSSGDYSGLGAGNQGLNALSTIDQADIASMEVLKDAAATAIYGTRAANGVVLITTRRGQAGATDIEFESSLGSSRFAQDFEGLSGNTFVTLVREGYRNEGRAIPASYADTLNQPTTRWWDQITQTGLVQNYRMGISGGNQRTRYRVSGGYSDEQGAMIKAGFRRMNGLVNVDHRWTENSTLFAKASYNRSTAERIGNDNYIYGVLTNGLLGRPNQLIYTDSTNTRYNTAAGPFSNPIAEANKPFTAVDTKFLGTAGIAYELLPGLSGRLEAGLDRFDLKEDRYNPNFTTQGAPRGNAQQNVTFYQNAIITGTLNYRQLFAGDHSVALLLGHSRERTIVNSLFLSGTTFVSNDLLAIAASATKDATNNATRRGLASYFTTGEYSFRNRYLASFTLRVDGSSRFGEDKRYAAFPAFSLGWNMAQEPFMQNVSALDLFKLRGSYGLTGQQEIGDFTSRYLWASNGVNYNGNAGLTTSQLGNNELTWEETKQGNIAVDFGLLRRLSGTFELYQKDTQKLLRNQPLPWSTGFAGQQSNVGQIRNRGWELQLDGRVLETHGFRWQAIVNLSSYRNEVIKLVDGDGDGEGDPIASGFASRIAEGQPLGVFYGWQVGGLIQSLDEVCTDPTGAACKTAGKRAFQAPVVSGGALSPRGTYVGDRWFVDRNGDGIINDDDRTYIGNPNPDLYGGITNNFTFKGFELGVFFQFSSGNDVLNWTKTFSDRAGNPYGTNPNVLNRWTPENTNTDVPRASVTDPNNNRRASDYFVEDGSYIRLKSLTLAYTVPARFTNAVRVRNLRIYFVGENLWTSTRYSGLDPEVSTFDRSNTSFGSDFFTYPQATRLTFGARVNL